MKTPFKTILKSVIKLLEDNLPKHLTYHNIPHTLYVLEKADHIAKKEGVKKTDLQLLKIAALYHDVGFIHTRDGHEVESCNMVKQQLPDFWYSKVEIDIICEAIMATKIPQKPTSHLGEILADADLEYLATNRFEPVSELLFNEMRYFNPKLTKAQWNAIQIDFISKHKYHTKFCKHYKSFRKRNNLEKLKREL